MSLGNSSSNTGIYSPFPPLNPVQGQSRPHLEWEYEGYNTPSPAIQHSSSYPLPQNQQPPAPAPRWEPTTTAQWGQPLLRNGQILVFPPSGHRVCTSCSDSGWKAFDPSRPCKKCWDKYGKPYGGPLRIALQSAVQDLPPGSSPPNSQTPLPKYRPPAPRASPSGYGMAPVPQTYGPPVSWMPQPSFGQQRALVVRPGDPRIGGELCLTCGGDGLIGTGFLGLDQDQ